MVSYQTLRVRTFKLMLRQLFTSGPVARSFLKDKTLTLQQGCGSDLREKTGSDPRKKTLDV